MITLMIWLTSDFHFNHNKEFVYKQRGFSCIEDMNETIIERFNSVVSPGDEVYILGDLMLGGKDNLGGLDYIHRLNGNLHVIIGNHDTEKRVDIFRKDDIIKSVEYATLIKYEGYKFYLSHYPILISNTGKDKLKKCLISLHGHTHQMNNFYTDLPFIYHVGVDSHDCYPVSIDEIIKECENKFKEFKE